MQKGDRTKRLSSHRNWQYVWFCFVKRPAFRCARSTTISARAEESNIGEVGTYAANVVIVVVDCPKKGGERAWSVSATSLPTAFKN
jgi:hypothetical protein